MPENPNPQIVQLRALMTEHGGAEHIPHEALNEIGYVRMEGPEGLVRVLPAARFAMEQAAIAEAANRPPLFERFTMTVETTSGYSTTVLADQYKEDVRRLAEHLLSPNSTVRHQMEWLAQDHPLNQFLAQLDTVPVRVTDPETKQIRVREFSLTDNGGLLANFTDRAEGKLGAQYGIEYNPARGLHDLVQTHAFEVLGLWDDEETEHITDGQSEQLWLFLDRMKAQYTDLDELETIFLENWLSGFVADKELTAREISQLPIDSESLPLVETNNDLEPLPSFVLQAQITVLQIYLANQGFSDVAAQLQGCASVEDMRQVLSHSLTNNSVITAFNARTKDLKRQRGELQEAADIHAFNRDYQAFKTAHKQQMRSLRGVNDYLNIPRLYAEFARHKIEEVQEYLTHKATGTIEVTIDPTHDERDKDPGTVSGDCTAGMPLPFGTEASVYNAKLETNTNHVGNIYLLDTTLANSAQKENDDPSSNESKVWHLEAIQWPNHAIDWDNFPRVLLGGLIPRADELDVTHITMNSAPRHISNYDYIARAFLGYVGIDPTVQSPQTLRQSKSPQQVTVAFPNVKPGQSNFQGRDEPQLVLWRNPRFST